MSRSHQPSRRTRRRRARRARRAEDGNLLLIAGVLLLLAFGTVIAIQSQLGLVEQQVTREQRTPLLDDFRMLRERLGRQLDKTIMVTTPVADFDDILDEARRDLKAYAHSHGYDITVERAGKDKMLARDEWYYTDLGYPDTYLPGSETVKRGALDEDANKASAVYFLRTEDNRLVWETAFPQQGGMRVAYDQTNDGILWVAPDRTPLNAGCRQGPSGQSCIQGAVIYFRLAGSDVEVDEFVVYGLNL